MRFETTELFLRLLVWRKCCKHPPPQRPAGAKLGAHSASTSQLARAFFFLHALCTMFTQQTISRINTASVFTKMILEALGLRSCADGLCILRTNSVMLEKSHKSKPRFQRSSAGRQQSRSARSPQDTKKAVQQREPDLRHHRTLGKQKNTHKHYNHTSLTKCFRPSATRLHESEKNCIDKLTCETTRPLRADIWCGESVANCALLKDLLASNWQHTHTASASKTSTS